MKWMACTLAAGLLLTSVLAAAEDGATYKAGNMYAVRRVVQARSPAAVRTLKMNEDVFSNEVIRTGGGARAQILFPDGSILGMGPSSEIVIAQYVQRGEGGSLKVQLNQGTLRVLGGAISKEEPIEVETPVATCGVRGSLAFFNYESARQQLSAMLINGTLTTTLPDGRTSTTSRNAAANDPVTGVNVSVGANNTPVFANQVEAAVAQQAGVEVQPGVPDLSNQQVAEAAGTTLILTNQQIVQTAGLSTPAATAVRDAQRGLTSEPEPEPEPESSEEENGCGYGH